MEFEQKTCDESQIKVELVRKFSDNMGQIAKLTQEFFNFFFKCKEGFIFFLLVACYLLGLVMFLCEKRSLSYKSLRVFFIFHLLAFVSFYFVVGFFYISSLGMAFDGFFLVERGVYLLSLGVFISWWGLWCFFFVERAVYVLVFLSIGRFFLYFISW